MDRLNDETAKKLFPEEEKDAVWGKISGLSNENRGATASPPIDDPTQIMHHLPGFADEPDTPAEGPATSVEEPPIEVERTLDSAKVECSVVNRFNIIDCVVIATKLNRCHVKNTTIRGGYATKSTLTNCKLDRVEVDESCILKDCQNIDKKV